jgi:4-hydroxybenzoate polyprenyltransferase
MPIPGILRTELRQRPDAGPVIVVDLERTLIKTDLLLESLIALVKQSPWRLFILPFWLAKGLAHFKRQVAQRVALDPAALPYKEEFVDLLRTERAQGRELALATAADELLARRVAGHLGLFEYVLASDGRANLSGKARRDRLMEQFGPDGFEYAGFKYAAAPQRQNPVAYITALRPRQWVKNFLVFAPLLAAHRFDDPVLFGRALVAFIAFGCIASSGYLINDLLDLAADRRHPRKKFRPFAAGDLALGYAFFAIPALICLSCLLACLLPKLFFPAVAAYFALSLTYSLYAKAIDILDVIVLAGLYTMRLLAGSAAVGIWPSHWLLAISTFLFFSLALVKRYGELAVMRRIDGDQAKARGYESSDGELLASMGIASGYVAVLVLALYINSETAQTLYGRYQLIWLLCPLLLYWVSHIWLIAHRGRMPDDPVILAFEDRTSRILLALMLAVGIFAL